MKIELTQEQIENIKKIIYRGDFKGAEVIPVSDILKSLENIIEKNKKEEEK